LIKVIWTNESLNRLVDIEEYISEDNPHSAEKFVNTLIKRAESLKQHPNKGRIVPEFSIPEIREIIEKNYRIVYRVVKNRIEILTVFEGHRLIRTKEIFRNR
jgi:addiction module RelE/StbE family toxin